MPRNSLVVPRTSLGAAIAFVILATPALAAEPQHLSSSHAAHARQSAIQLEADAQHHHHHLEGGWMLAYRFMSMSMEGMLRGSDSITPEQVVTEVSNPHPGPGTVRVVPQAMDTRMHMLSAMYAHSNRLTFMAMAHYLENEMDLTTYAGMMGTDVAGDFSTASSGIGDTRLSLLWGLHDRPAKVRPLRLQLPQRTRATTAVNVFI